MVKLQVCCLIILLFIAGVYFQAKRERTYSHIIFSVSLGTGIFCILWDIITVHTVNHLDEVSPIINRFAHDLFLGSLIMEAFLCFAYSLTLIYNDKVSKKTLWVTAVPVWFAWLGLLLLPIRYVQTPKGNYSWGPAVYTVHFTVIFYLIVMVIVMWRHWNEINPKKRYVVILALFIEFSILTYETFVPVSLMSSMVVMLVNLSFFLTVESPDVLLMNRLREEKRRADEANEAKSQFLSSMSHEIRTPMNAIVGMTDIVLREELSSNVREYLNNIKNSGDALLTIINDILDFSKIESGKMEIVEENYEPMSMLHDMSMIFLNRIGEKDIELLYEVDPDVPVKLYGDSQRIRQIIINLMNNAIKYTDSGYVRLKVETEKLDKDTVNVIFSVEDTGEGIKEEDIDKLFVSFQQVDIKKNYKKEGTGLGLAICKRLVELMHGVIGVQSVYGEGSVFTFSVPQKIVDATPAARLKEEKERNYVVGYRLGSPVEQGQLKKLADSYQIECVDIAKTKQQGEPQETLPEKHLDFLITDDITGITKEEKKRISESGGRICVLKNPMMDNISDVKYTVINKPLYSLNFCQLLNGESQVFVHNPSENFKFTAPHAQILLVDDNDMNLKVAEGLMAPYQMQIDTAKDGKQALQMVQDKHYNIVFMDHMMPVMDGIESTEEIRKLDGDYYKKLPIIALSANATSEARDMFQEADMNGFIAKPIREKELASCIQEWLPAEMMIPAEETQEDLEEDEEKEELPVIEGLDVEEAIRNCGSKELFMELLGDFYRLIDSKSEKLVLMLLDNKIRDFTIEVHALKNNARMIGAMELSQLFYQMEQLGNAQKKSEIEEGMPKLLDLYRSYKDILADYVKEPEGKKEKVSADTICQTLEKLHSAVDNFDLDATDSAMQELETYEVPEDIEPMIEQLRIYVTDVAMEEILDLTQKIALRFTENCEQ